MTDRDWIYVGAKVASVVDEGGIHSVSIETVAKVLKDTIVLENGERYRRDNLRKVGSAHSWMFLTIEPLDNPQVVEYLARKARRIKGGVIKMRLDEWVKTGDADLLAEIKKRVEDL